MRKRNQKYYINRGLHSLLSLLSNDISYVYGVADIYSPLNPTDGYMETYNNWANKVREGWNENIKEYTKQAKNKVKWWWSKRKLHDFAMCFCFNIHKKGENKK